MRALDETLDIDNIRAHLATIPAICAGGSGAGPIGELPQRNRFHWLVAPRSTIIQPSPGNWVVNASIAKGFPLADQMRLEVRLDALNRVNDNSPHTSIASPDFGRLLSAQSPRTAQTAAPDGVVDRKMARV